MKIRVCGLDFDDIGTEHAVRAALTGENACFVVTPNALMLEDCARSPEHLRLLSGASLILPDGGGVVRAAARLGTPFAHGRVAGIDFGEALLSACAARGERVFLLGGADGVAACAAENLRRGLAAVWMSGRDGFVARRFSGRRRGWNGLGGCLQSRTDWQISRLLCGFPVSAAKCPTKQTAICTQKPISIRPS